MSQEEIPARRSALGDVTNQIVGKRGFSDDTSFHSAKKECVRLDNNFTKQNFRKWESVLRPHSCSDIYSSKGVSHTATEIKEQCVSGVRENAKDSIAVKDGEVVRDSCVPIGMSDADGSRVVLHVEDDEKTDSLVVLSKGKGESSLGVNVEDNDVSVGNLESSKDEYLDVSRFPESQESTCGLERCIGQKGGDGFSSMCVDMIKSCSCSFCTKAAYLWSDLHYQDMKGRIAAVKKSQKEASILVHQNSRDVATGRHGQGNVGNYSNLESDLTGRWKSLFLHVEDIFVRESIQLETNLSTLKELRDDCKTDSDK